MGSQIEITVDSTNARRYIASVLNTLRKGGTQPGPIRDFYTVAAARYLAFVRARFIRASRGDGTWKPLALATKIKRLQKIAPARLRQFIHVTPGRTRAEQLANLAGTRPFPILRDTGLLFNSLTSGAPGSVRQYGQDSVTVGTNIKYAGFHQNGGTIPGRPPQRTILVPPDDTTVEAMLNDLTNALLQAIGEEERASRVPPPAAA